MDAGKRAPARRASCISQLRASHPPSRPNAQSSAGLASRHAKQIENACKCGNGEWMNIGALHRADHRPSLPKARSPTPRTAPWRRPHARGGARAGHTWKAVRGCAKSRENPSRETRPNCMTTRPCTNGKTREERERRRQWQKAAARSEQERCGPGALHPALGHRPRRCAPDCWRYPQAESS